jgi:hypothetical protein
VALSLARRLLESGTFSLPPPGAWPPARRGMSRAEDGRMKKIKRVKLDVDSMSEPELLAFGRTVETKLNESTTFDTLDSKTAMLGTALGTLDTRIKDVSKREAELEQAGALLDDQRELVINILASLGSGVEQIAEGETTIVLASGFDVQAERAPVGPLGAPQNLRAATADIEGQVKARWNKVRGARAYIVEIAPESGGDWKQTAVLTRVSCVVPGLDSGKRYRIRVCAVGATGQGPWSDEAVRMAA